MSNLLRLAYLILTTAINSFYHPYSPDFYDNKTKNTPVRNVAFSKLTQRAVIMINIIAMMESVSRCENAP